MDPTEDLSARVLLKHILSTETPRTPITRSSSQARTTSATRSSNRLSKKDAGPQTPQDILRRSLRHKIRESITRQSLPSTHKRTASVRLRKTNTPAPTSLLFDDGETPRHMLMNILRTEPVKSPVVHERVASEEPRPSSADSSITRKRLSIELSGLDLTDITIGNAAASTAKGLSRKRPRRSLNVTAFEKCLKDGDDVEEENEESIGDHSSLSLSSSTSLSLKTPFVEVQTEKKGLQRRISNRRKITVEEFGAAVNKRQMGGVSSFVQGERGLSETAYSEGFSLGLSKLSEPDITTDILHCNTALYAQPDAMTSSFSIIAATQDKPTVMASQLQRQLEQEELMEAERSNLGKDKSIYAFPTEEGAEPQNEEAQDVAGSQISVKDDTAESEEEENRVEAQTGGGDYQTEEQGAADSHTEEDVATRSQSEEEEAAADSQTEEEVAADSQTEEEVAAESQTEEEVAAESQTEEEVAAESQTEEEVAVEFQDEGAVECQTAEEGAGGSQTEEDQGAMDSHTEDDVATRSQSEEEEAAADSQTEEEVAADSQTEEEVAADSQTEEEVAAESQTEEEVAAESQTEEEVAAESQTEEEVAAESQTEEEVAVEFQDEGAVECQTEEEGAGGSQTEEDQGAMDSHTEDDVATRSQSEEEEAAADSQTEEEVAADSQTEEEQGGVDSQYEEDVAAGSQSEEEDFAPDSQMEEEGAVELQSVEEVVEYQSDQEDPAGSSLPEDEHAGRLEEEDEASEQLEPDVEHISRRAHRSEGGLSEPVIVEGGDLADATEAGWADGKSKAHCSLEMGSHESGPLHIGITDLAESSTQRQTDASYTEDDKENSFNLPEVAHDNEDGGHLGVDSPEGAAAQDPAEQVEEWEEEEDDEEDDEDSDEIPSLTPAFVKQKITFFQPNPLASPSVFKNVQASSSPGAVFPSPKQKQVRKRRKRPAKKETDLPKSYLMGVFKHFAKTKVSADVYPVLKEIMDKYFDRLAEDLETYAGHAKRKTIEFEDAELLLKRQGYVNDKVPVEVLIEKYLRMDQRKLLIPIATSGNVVVPKKRR